jgi:photosystem II stability/assembly factor-like uncharacterized protein
LHQQHVPFDRSMCTVVLCACTAVMLQIKAWQQVQLPVATTLYDIAFDTAEPSHGFVVGAKGTFLEVNNAVCNYIENDTDACTTVQLSIQHTSLVHAKLVQHATSIYICVPVSRLLLL